MEMFIETLRPLDVLQNKLSTENSISISSVRGTLDHIKKVCSSEIICDVPEECKEVSREIRAGIWTYMENK